MNNSQPTVLVAEDDDGIVEAITLILEDAGYHVNAIFDGLKMFELKDPLPDLILLDIWLTGIDGRDICKHLKQQQSTKNIPVILVSANRDVGNISSEVGADGFLAKPFEMEELLTLIKDHLNKTHKLEV